MEYTYQRSCSVESDGGLEAIFRVLVCVEHLFMQGGWGYCLLLVSMLELLLRRPDSAVGQTVADFDGCFALNLRVLDNVAVLLGFGVAASAVRQLIGRVVSVALPLLLVLAVARFVGWLLVARGRLVELRHTAGFHPRLSGAMAFGVGVAASQVSLLCLPALLRKLRVADRHIRVDDLLRFDGLHILRLSLRHRVESWLAQLNPHQFTLQLRQGLLVLSLLLLERLQLPLILLVLPVGYDCLLHQPFILALKLLVFLLHQFNGARVGLGPWLLAH
jgi:hypothetical protein